MTKKGRVFAGIRCTGRQHLGNYLGAMQNFVALQDEYDCVYSAVDVHTITTPWQPDELRENVWETVLDLLAAGIEPERTILYVQSHVPEVLELAMLLGMITPLGWLTRVTTFKDKVRLHPENVNYGLVGYPVLMTADIILYKADTVPVGEDQQPHLELAREIARRFNRLFGETFPEPYAKLTEAPVVLGLDGVNKMSKSLDNQIDLAATPEETLRRVMTAVTDPQRTHRHIPGRPWVCNIYSLHHHFNPDQVEVVYEECTTAKRGCVECKQQLADGINRMLAPFRERRQELADRPSYVEEALADGAARARKIASVTLAEAREKMGLPAPYGH
jgi:tryptophanyl-tRNA synthetase